MDGAETPKKAAKRSVNRASGYRIRKCSLIVSTEPENLVGCQQKICTWQPW